jgi:SAM-dependent methyltransferase
VELLLMHEALAPSPWVCRWSALIRRGGSVLDVACGNGRHLRWLQQQGFAVTGVDRDEPALASLRACGEVIVADIENAPWPLTGRRFDAVVVTNYLWRALLPTLREALAPGGTLIYETFAVGNERYGKPSNPAFLLRAGELLEACRDLEIVAYEDGLLDHPLRRVQRVVARRQPAEPAPLESDAGSTASPASRP